MGAINCPECTAWRNGNTYLLDVVMTMVAQYADPCAKDVYCDHGLSTLEEAFAVLVSAGVAKYYRNNPCKIKLSWKELSKRMKDVELTPESYKAAAERICREGAE